MQLKALLPLDTIMGEYQFDGIWQGGGSVTLIKQLGGYVILQGKDKATTWSAKGIINKNQLICRGTGVTNG